MRKKALSSLVSAFSCLLASFCLHYGVAKPSVWPRKSGCNRRQFSDFRSDSPLNFTSFWFRFGSVGEAFRACQFFVPQSTARSVSACTLQSWTTARCSSIYFCWRLPCLVSRWKSCVNQFTVERRVHSRVRHAGMTVCAVVGLSVASGKEVENPPPGRLDLAR